MNLIDATLRDTKTKSDIRNLRLKGMIPAIVYGGEEKNQKIFLNKKKINALISSDGFLSNVMNLKINGKQEKVLPREIAFNPISDEPIHIDFLRIVKGSTLILEIPVKFINNEKSPGLKKGGVLNIVRRKIELRCPTENIPNDLIVDLDNTEIGTSIKISSIKLPENVSPTIQGRDFVVATIAAPTIVVEPEKPVEETAVEGEVDGATEEMATTEGENKAEIKEKKPAETKEKKLAETKEKKPAETKEKKPIETKKDPLKK